MSRAAGRQKGKRAGYRQTTRDERLLAVLRIESGDSIADVATCFGVSLSAVETWIEEWRSRHHGFGFDDELAPYEESAGYVLVRNATDNADYPYRSRYHIERGPHWSRPRLETARVTLARDTFLAAIADTRSMVAPGRATLAAIHRVYRSLDGETQALYTPIWDLCQLAVDEIEAGRTKLQRAADLASRESGRDPGGSQSGTSHHAGGYRPVAERVAS